MRKVMFATLIAAVGASAISANAASVLMDLGGYSTYTGTSSPAHAAGFATGSSWNAFGTTLGAISNKTSGWVDENGATVPGLSLTWGVETAAGSNTVSYDNAGAGGVAKSVDALDNPAYPFFDNALMDDQVLRASTTAGVALGIKISGLAEGNYQFFITAFRGDAASGNQTNTYNIYSATSGTDVTDFSALSSKVINNTDVSAWTEDNNYVRNTFTIDATNPNLYIIVDGHKFAGADFLGLANSLEITAVPEPAAMALLGATVLPLLSRRRSRQ